MQQAFLILGLAAALSTAAVSAQASPASAVHSVDRQNRGGDQGSELNMIRTQSLVSQRQQAVQQTTNILKNMNGSCFQCIQNLGK